MASSPVFTASPRVATASVSAANAARDGSGNLVIVFTAGPLGSRVDQICIAATATTTAGQLGLYVSSDTGTNTALNTYLIEEIAVLAATPSTTVQSFGIILNSNVNVELLPIFLQAGQCLRMDTKVANNFGVVVIGSDF